MAPVYLQQQITMKDRIQELTNEEDHQRKHGECMNKFVSKTWYRRTVEEDVDHH
jgi:hypothetical protein